MLKFQAHYFVEALSTLSDLDYIARHDPDWLYKNQTNIDQMAAQLRTLRGNVEMLKLKQSLRKVKMMQTLLDGAITKNTPALASLMTSHCNELKDRIVGELEDRAVYFIEDSTAEFMQMGPEPFGPKVAAQFPMASEDIEEAAFCLGLSRNTAAVFHLMRVMETAVKALGEKLKCTVVDKDNKDLEWGKILANIRTKVEEMPKGDKRDEWSEVVTLLYHVKQAWRNTTMHPKQTYTGSEAAKAFNAVQAFTQRLSELEAA
jgi:hypothetical protein